VTTVGSSWLTAAVGQAQVVHGRAREATDREEASGRAALDVAAAASKTMTATSVCTHTCGRIWIPPRSSGTVRRHSRHVSVLSQVELRCHPVTVVDQQAHTHQQQIRVRQKPYTYMVRPVRRLGFVMGQRLQDTLSPGPNDFTSSMNFC
jgi:hypothetical protein